jgi:SNF2 family DNA or RNA helicase
LVGSLPDFKSLIANPIIKAKLSSASLFEKLEGEKALSTVRSMLSHILLRRTQADILRSSLPPRLDVMILCTLDNLQKLSYDDEATELLK